MVTVASSLDESPRIPQRGDLVDLLHFVFAHDLLVMTQEPFAQSLEDTDFLMRGTQDLDGARDGARSRVEHASEPHGLGLETCDPIPVPLEQVDLASLTQDVSAGIGSELHLRFRAREIRRRAARSTLRAGQIGLRFVTAPATHHEQGAGAEAERFHDAAPRVAASSAARASG
jgi:hypothetical protein